MTPRYVGEGVILHEADCIELMRALPDNCVDSIVTDPPYGLGFMGKGWDDLPPGLDWAVECLRVLKPGGHLLAFGGTRTWHRLAVAVEDAGFEVRDSIAWLYGSGFPKSLDVSKAIDKRGGNPGLAAEIGAAIKDSRLARGWTAGQADKHFCGGSTNWTWYEGRKGECRPPTPDNFARIVEEWPELAALAEKVNAVDREVVGKAAWSNSANHFVPGEDHTSRVNLDITAPATPEAVQWQGFGTALKPAFEPVVVARKPLIGTVAANVLAHGTGALNIDGCRIETDEVITNHHGTNGAAGVTFGQRREYVPGSASADNTHDKGRWPANVALDDDQAGVLGDSAKFMYVAKAPTKERPKVDGVAHPTVKPLALMRWLVRLVTPPGGLVLEPFAGSGTTIEACILEGFRCIAIEREPEYLPLILERIRRATPGDGEATA